MIPLIAGLGIGGVALWLGVKTLNSAGATPRPAAKVQVWAARENIARGAKITAEMLQALPFPKELAPAGSFTKQEQLVGRVPNMVAPAGLPILAEMLAPPGTPPGIYVKPGFRAVAVKIDASSGVDYHLEPGCFVDVVGSFKVRRDGQTQTIAKRVVENVEIAAVGERLSPNVGEEEEQQGRARTVRAVTLFVRPDQVNQLHLAEQLGRIKLSLRSNEDSGTHESTGEVTSNDLTSDDTEPVVDQHSDERHEGLGARIMEWLAAASTTTTPLVLTPPAPPERTVRVWHGAKNLETLTFTNPDGEESSSVGWQPAQPGQSPAARPPFPAPQPPARTQAKPETEIVDFDSEDDAPQTESEHEPKELYE